MMAKSQATYLPAAGKDWGLPLYDPLVKLMGIDATRRTLIAQASLDSVHRVLDMGCGTGSLSILIKRLHPAIEVTGLDPDPKALARSRRKAAQAGVSIGFDQGFSNELPYPDGSFDRVFSSFMFHHVHAEQREKTLREVRRVLIPGGSFHMVDLVRPDENSANWLPRLIHSSEHLKDNSENILLELMRQAGLANARRIAGESIFFGLMRIGYFEGFLARQ